MKPVILVADNNLTLNNQMSISEERLLVLEDHLTNVTKKANENNPSIGEVLRDSVNIAENENEAAYLAFAIGHYIGSMNNHMTSIMDLLSGNESEKGIEETVNMNDQEVEG